MKSYFKQLNNGQMQKEELMRKYLQNQNES